MDARYLYKKKTLKRYIKSYFDISNLTYWEEEIYTHINMLFS